MSENKTNSSRCLLRGPRGPMGHGPRNGHRKGQGFQGLYKEAHKVSRQILGCNYCSYDFCSSFDCLLRCRTEGLGKATTALAEGLMNKIAGTGGIDFAYIAKVLLFTLALYLVSAIFMFVQGLIMTGITQKTCYRMRKDITSKINRMPMKYFEQADIW